MKKIIYLISVPLGGILGACIALITNISVSVYFTVFDLDVPGKILRLGRWNFKILTIAGTIILPIVIYKYLKDEN